MSTHITKNRILDFTVSMKIQQRSANTINSYTTNIQKLELFLRGAELTKEQMLLYKQWLSSQGFKQSTVNAYLAAANYFCDVMGWTDMKVALDPVETEDIVQNKKQISSSNYKKLVFTALQNDKERLAMMIQVLCHMDLRFCELERLTVEALECNKVVVERKHRHKEIEIPVDRSNFRKDIKKLCILADIEEEFGSIQHIKHVVLDEYPYYGLKKWK